MKAYKGRTVHLYLPHIPGEGEEVWRAIGFDSGYVESCECSQAIMSLWARVKATRAQEGKNSLLFLIIQDSASLWGEWPSLPTQYSITPLCHYSLPWPIHSEHYPLFKLFIVHPLHKTVSFQRAGRCISSL